MDGDAAKATGGPIDVGHDARIARVAEVDDLRLDERPAREQGDAEVVEPRLDAAVGVDVG